jgi:NOL1/NOP2/sun family putative RNA methylase
MESLLGEDSIYFFNALESQSPTSLRINKQKFNASFDHNEQIPWNSLGRYLLSRPSFTLDPTFHAGSYYVQEASSMIITQILLQLGLKNKSLKVLDLCAAPGGKTTLLHDNLNCESVIVANEVIKNRANILKENIIKWGCKNVIVTSVDPTYFQKSGLTFDLILVDAPCSGEGMFRKDTDAIKEWSLDSVAHCSLRQKRILDDIIPCLNQDGHIIYSTCTFNHQENIDQVIYMQNHYGLKSLQINVNDDWGVTYITKENASGYQCYPHKTKGEGFFFAVLQKDEAPKPQSVKSNPSKLKLLNSKEVAPMQSFVTPDVLSSIYQHPNGDCYHLTDTIIEYTHIAQSQLNLQYAGVKLGTLTKNLFLPDHALALSPILNQSVPTIELNLEDALSYLRRTLTSINSLGNGWQIAQYQGFNMGWFKQLGNRINNYYPVDWRVRM